MQPHRVTAAAHARSAPARTIAMEYPRNPLDTAQHRSSRHPHAMIKRRITPELARLRRRIAQLDSDSVDQLYGLEPVWEPGSGARLAAEEFVGVLCPYCGERLETRVDLTADE